MSYIDERLAMVNCYETTSTTDDRPYYYCLDAMYNVKFLVDRAGAIVERYAYDPYGKPLIRESTGRGDTRHYSLLYTDTAADINAEVAGTIWDPRCDLDDDGDVDSTDQSLYAAKDSVWPQPSSDQPTVSQAFSDVGNPYMFQGVPHFAIDTSSSATTVKFPLNHHRARFAEPVTGRWVTRDPLEYNLSTIRSQSYYLGVAEAFVQYNDRTSDFIKNQSALFSFNDLTPTAAQDPFGLCCCFQADRSFSRFCFKLSGADVVCSGPVTYPDWRPEWFGGPGTRNFTTAPIKDFGYDQDCASCDPKCLPVFMYILVPTEFELQILFEVPIVGGTFYAPMRCEVEAGFWISLWTCCGRN